MCGLFAGSGKIETDKLMALGVSNIPRGKDSAGIGWIEPRENGKIRSVIAKIAEHPANAFTMTLKNDLEAASKSGVMIGHTRQATQGKVSNRNAHPFLVDNIAFAHNGIIINDADFGKFEVDSECLYEGIKKKDFSLYVGCIALVWIEGGLLHAYRKGNPLYRGKLNGGTYLSSEREHLTRIRATNIRELAEGHVYIFKGASILNQPLRVPTNEVFEYQSATVHHGYGLTENDWKAPEKSYNDIFPDTPPPSKQEVCMGCDKEICMPGLDYGPECAHIFQLPTDSFLGTRTVDKNNDLITGSVGKSHDTY